jgi:hypothetical protein
VQARVRRNERYRTPGLRQPGECGIRHAVSLGIVTSVDAVNGLHVGLMSALSPSALLPAGQGPGDQPLEPADWPVWASITVTPHSPHPEIAGLSGAE